MHAHILVHNYIFPRNILCGFIIHYTVFYWAMSLFIIVTVCLPWATSLLPSLLFKMSTLMNAMVLPTLRHSATIDKVSSFFAGLMYLDELHNALFHQLQTSLVASYVTLRSVLEPWALLVVATAIEDITSTNVAVRPPWSMFLLLRCSSVILSSQEHFPPSAYVTCIWNK